jgi:hypothetical protein
MRGGRATVEALPTERPATLGVLEAAKAVVDEARLVRIDPAAVERFAALRGRTLVAGAHPDPGTYLGFVDGTSRTAQYVLVADAMNFSFWGEPKWTIAAGGRRLDGWWAFVAALRRALEEGWPLLDAQWLSAVRTEDLAQIFRGEGELPLLEERARHLRELGGVLLQRYDGESSRLVTAAGQSAVCLVQTLVTVLPSFNDTAVYRGRRVPFYKRAQITVADLAIAFQNRGLGHFTDLDQLTAFADYKLPQVLRREGILVYAPALATDVDTQCPLPPGGAAEVEIRAATIWAVELLRRALTRDGTKLTSAEIDEVLWDLGQRPDPRDRPYHRTRTVFY